MAGRVIQGFFIGGALRPQPVPRAEARPPHPTGAPPPTFAGPAAPLQGRMAPGRPPLAHRGAGHVAQPHGGSGSFEIDPAQIGLARGGGKPLPEALLAKMEAAFGADFSAVRIHVGPQASRIGAIAFTTGNDLYFAPGRYQPESVQGQQLIGHELAHVVQQRQGRVRAPGSGVAVVQDRMLEAEADRLGLKAASHHRAGPTAASTACAADRGTRPSAIQPSLLSWGGTALGLGVGAAAGALAAPLIGAGALGGAAFGAISYLGGSSLFGGYYVGGSGTVGTLEAGKKTPPTPSGKRHKIGVGLVNKRHKFSHAILVIDGIAFDQTLAGTLNHKQLATSIVEDIDAPDADTEFGPYGDFDPVRGRLVEVEVPLEAIKKAFNAANGKHRLRLGQYRLILNSCASNVSDVLRAAGLPPPIWAANEPRLLWGWMKTMQEFQRQLM